MRAPFLLCFFALAVVRPAASADQLTAQEVVSARKIYVAKCAKCHRFYEPTNYADGDWRRWMDSMNRTAKLKPEQATLLNRFLDAYRAGQLSGKPQDRRGPARSGAATP